jgi:hypothetical protein
LASSLFDICRKHGAIIVTGDQHLYTRTRSISEFDFEESSLVQTSDYLKLNGSKIEVLRAVPGRTFIVNSGLGGQTPAGADSLTNPSVYAKIVGKDVNTSSGVFFCELKASPPELKNEKDKDIASKGYCYFKNVDDEVLDRIIVQIK